MTVNLTPAHIRALAQMVRIHRHDATRTDARLAREALTLIRKGRYYRKGEHA